MSREEIEQAIEGAGWELDGGFSGHLIVGENENLFILAHRWVWEIDDPVFELCDEERNLAYRVWVVPIPQQATELLEEHRRPPEEEQGNPYKRVE